MSSAIDNSYNSALGLNQLTGKGAEMDKQAFLMLMVTQFQYQDPLNPTEDKEFVAQLAQFTSMEQMMNMNKSMDGLVAAQNQQLVIGAASFIGKEVSARGYGVSITDGVASTIFYASDDEIATGMVNIFDANKQPIASIKLPATSAGVHKFEWDGKKLDGTMAADGVYTITITTAGTDGEPIITDTQISGIVDGVSTYNGKQFLRLADGRVVALEEVREILEPKKPADPEKPPIVDPEDPTKPPIDPDPEDPTKPPIDPDPEDPKDPPINPDPEDPKEPPIETP